MSWPTVPLAELTTKIGSGATPRGGSKAYKSEGTPLVRSMNVHDGVFQPDRLAFIDEKQAHDLDNVILSTGDVLLNITGASVARCCRLPSDYAGGRVNQHVAIIRPKKDVLRGDYLEHLLTSPDTKRKLLGIAGGGATREAITKAAIENFEIPLPPFNEQKRIAAILDQADALRRLRARALDRLNTVAQAIFHEMFGDVVRNDRGFPTVAVGDVIAGFETGKNLAEDPDGGAPGATRVLKISSVTGGTFRPEESKPLPSDYIAPAQHFVRNGDILFSRANTAELIGATAMVVDAPDNLVLPDKLWRFVWKADSPVEAGFVLSLFSSPAFRREISKRATGTSGSMKNIGQSKVLAINFGCPPLSDQAQFCARISENSRTLKTAKAAAARSDALFTSLQHRAFRGEL